MKSFSEKWRCGPKGVGRKIKKEHKDKYKSPPVGFSLTRTQSDSGCGPHDDKRLKRKHTRGAKRREWERDNEL